VVFYLTDFSCRGALDKQFGTSVVWDVDLLSGYEHHFVGSNWATASPYGFLSLRTPAIARSIQRAGLDALVLHGHDYAANLIALAAARAARVPVFYKAETHLALPRGRIKSLLRPMMLKALFAQITGFLAIGTKNAEFYRSLGVQDDRIFNFPYTVDNARFIAGSALSADERKAKRASLGLDPTKPVVLFVSKLMRRKHPDHLLAACARLAAEGLEFQLAIAGTGELEQSLRERAASEPGLVTVFPGFVNQSELPSLFAASDIFVLPSEDEPWGLIVNEAMCAGLPIVASQEIGCVTDLVRNGENGFTFPVGDVGELTRALRKLVDDAALRERMGRRSRDVIANWGFDQNHEGLRAALSALPHPSR
jgi:glycosyltransferase involved in cell wall biosynthesis